MICKGFYQVSDTTLSEDCAYTLTKAFAFVRIKISIVYRDISYEEKLTNIWNYSFSNRIFSFNILNFVTIRGAADSGPPNPTPRPQSPAKNRIDPKRPEIEALFWVFIFQN